jgi:SAM-dependent methyltransferase
MPKEEVMGLLVWLCNWEFTMICEVCRGEYGNLKLDLGSHPLCDDLTPIGSNEVADKFQQLISLCERCLTAHQMVPVKKELLFKPTYHYRAGLTRDVIDGMRTLVKDLAGEFSKESGPTSVLDIGCNDGSLLGIFKEEYGSTTIGVDPTGAILESGNKVDYAFNEYFTEATAHKIKQVHPNITLITFTNVFAHIEDLPKLLENLRDLIGESTTLVIENHYLGSILNQNQFDTFYHEHPRTYSLRSFQFIATTLGLTITQVKFPSRYGGNIRVTMKQNGEPADLARYVLSEDSFVKSFSGLQEIYNTWKIDSAKALSELSSRGPIHGKALPGRAVMLINALKLDHSRMPIIFEQPTSPKVGNYVPSTQIKVLSDEELLSNSPKVLIVWSWHIIDEIVKYLDSIGYKGEIWVPLPEFRMFRSAV